MKHLLIVTTFALFLFVSTPLPAHAVGAATGIDPVQAMKEWGLDTLAWFIGGMLSGELTRETADWVNSGFNALARSVRIDPTTGEPQVYTYTATGGTTFVLDPQAFFLDLSTGAAMSLFDQLTAATGTDPNQAFDTIFPGFKDDILREIAGETQGLTGNFLEEFVSDFQTDEELAQRSAYIDDFTQGGWSMFLTATQNCANNYSCTRLAVLQELNSQIAEKTVQTERELQQGGGFLSIRKCAVDPIPVGGCPEYVDVTPGKLLGEQIVKATNTEFDRANASDELTEILVVLLQQAMDALINEGLSSLSRTLNTNYEASGGRAAEEAQIEKIKEDAQELEQTLREGTLEEGAENDTTNEATSCTTITGGTLCTTTQDVEIDAFALGSTDEAFSVVYTGTGTFESDVEYDFGEYTDNVTVTTNSPDGSGTGVLETGDTVVILVTINDLTLIENFNEFSGTVDIGDMRVNIQGVDRRIVQ